MYCFYKKVNPGNFIVTYSIVTIYKSLRSKTSFKHVWNYAWSFDCCSNIQKNKEKNNFVRFWKRYFGHRQFWQILTKPKFEKST